MEVRLSGLLFNFTQKKAKPEGVTFRYFNVTMTKLENSPLLHTSFLCLKKEPQHSDI